LKRGPILNATDFAVLKEKSSISASREQMSSILCMAVIELCKAYRKKQKHFEIFIKAIIMCVIGSSVCDSTMASPSR